MSGKYSSSDFVKLAKEINNSIGRTTPKVAIKGNGYVERDTADILQSSATQGFLIAINQQTEQKPPKGFERMRQGLLTKILNEA